MIRSAVFAFAALSGPLPKAGVMVVAALAAVVVVGAPWRLRAVAMVGALVLSPVLLLADIWHSPQLSIVHRHPLEAVVGAAVVVAVLLAAAAALARRPALVAPLAVLTLPFRVPIQSGQTTNNLLVPLYFVVAAASLAWIWSALRASRDEATPTPPVRAGLIEWTARLLALYVVLYGIQAAYSAGFEKALQNMVFFYVPFSLLFRLLRDTDWRAENVRRCLYVTVALALVFSLIGFYEYASKTTLLNPKIVAANSLHTYFTVNSVFLDPDIFGRYLALVMILVAVVLIHELPRREQGIACAVLAVLWSCLVLTLSRSSLGALLVGLAVLAALRWRPSRALVVAVVVIGLGAAAVAATPTTFGLNQGANGASSGRSGLVSGGLSLFGDRPGWGYGSGSFVAQYRAHHRHTATSLAASHTIAITIAAEQGVIGELAYLALVVSAMLCLVRAARGDPVRSAVAAAFVALMFHTLLYADFLEDPMTWVLLGVGLALAAAPRKPGFATRSGGASWTRDPLFISAPKG